MAKKAAAKPIKLGTKRLCPKCNTKFYDFEKSKIACPSCKSTIDLSEPQKPHLTLAPETAKKTEPTARGPEFLDDAAESDTGDTAFEDLSELDDDEEDFVKDIGVDDKDDTEY